VRRFSSCNVNIHTDIEYCLNSRLQARSPDELEITMATTPSLSSDAGAMSRVILSTRRWKGETIRPDYMSGLFPLILPDLFQQTGRCIQCNTIKVNKHFEVSTLWYLASAG
jgi:hypothetical protein